MLQFRKRWTTWMSALAAIALLSAWPVVVGADESWIPPEARWTPTPPASHDIDTRQLIDLLLKKGLISPREMALLEGSKADQEGSTRQAGVGPLTTRP